ncbi:MAG: cytochrome C oxidase subunit I [Bacteroidetes bacterium]|nr:cytochrome C oxidase subunit I [Bacteroidota bacterium]
MFAPQGNIATAKTTSYKVVLPFYGYAAISFLAGTVMLLINTKAFTGHYFQPPLLAITHTMALGWGTMIILGASHQLVPVLIEGELYSNKLAYASFICAAVGIPPLVSGFYMFDLGNLALAGGILVVISVLLYMTNLVASIRRSKHRNIHATFVVAATLWLLVTTIIGVLLLCNFRTKCLPEESLHYLSLHAHLGIAGWFLLTVIGVGARLIPLFLISKYSHTAILRWIFYLINVALISFFFLFLSGSTATLLIPITMIFVSILLFVFYCFRAYKERIRKQVDDQMKISLLSTYMIPLPMIFLAVVIGALILSGEPQTNLVSAYGFLIFFGWLTAIILGMTFKTLPFIVWHKTYHKLSGKGKTPNPKDLFSERVFHWMSVSYLAGVPIFAIGVITTNQYALQAGSLFLLFAAILYIANVFKIMSHSPKHYGNNN